MNYFNVGTFFLFDPLAVFFLCVILLISFPAAVYSVGYLKGAYSKRKIVLGWALFLAFVLSMALVVCVSNAFLFLIAWELMSLVSYFLVIFDTGHERSVRAGSIYIIMTHIGTAFIISALLMLFKHAHSFDFFALKQAAGAIPGNEKNLIFALFLVGFGTKAGIVPLHIWLPLAHPQAPSHISSIMSGVMIKTAIYGMLRFIIFILGINSWWWGNVILVLAVISCLAGVMYALVEHDLKKLLAYHSVENIGIILLGVGAAMLLAKMNLNVIAVLALSAGLYHLVNHAIFKGLLFLCAGSVYKSCETRDMEKLGGLVKLMPWTAASFLIGSMAISAIPPFNGFVSEWLTLQALFLGALNSMGGNRIFFGLCAAALALTGGLAASCFVKAFAVTFLAMPRSLKAGSAKEVPFSMKAAAVFLSAAALAFGLAAALIIKPLAAVAGEVLGIETNAMSFSLNNFSLIPPGNSGVFLSTPLLAFVLLAAIPLAFISVRLFFGRNRIKAVNTWDCGYYSIGARNEYTATAFSKPFRIAFGFFLLPYRKTEKIRESFYHVTSFKYEVFTTPIFRRYIYDPIIKLVFGTAKFVRRIQPGSIHLYIAYIFIAILALIIFMNKF
ncbi:MAG: proton-conducting transporter membrane subunit [Candidatus Omnitrophica bacterium]|nr:proton-conducting transporter membrane subunit [Candidatus Omnitrophota bacterium]